MPSFRSRLSLNSRARIAAIGSALLIPAMLAGCQSHTPLAERMNHCPASPNCVSSLEPENDGAHIAPLALSDAQPRKQWILDTLKNENRVKVVVQEDDYIHATFTSLLFRFVDDVEFDLSKPTHVDVRSASRVGYSDLGANRRRVEHLREVLQEKAGK